ncbi:hypothetical protein ACLESD_02520 [Pyxidicoccus sp. 3LFB2]
MTEDPTNTETHPFASCIELACKLNTDSQLYAQFQDAMSAGGTTFSTWLATNGVPPDIANQLASQSGNQLFQTVGEVVCERFW